MSPLSLSILYCIHSWLKCTIIIFFLLPYFKHFIGLTLFMTVDVFECFNCQFFFSNTSLKNLDVVICSFLVDHTQWCSGCTCRGPYVVLRIEFESVMCKARILSYLHTSSRNLTFKVHFCKVAFLARSKQEYIEDLLKLQCPTRLKILTATSENYDLLFSSLIKE